jgi:hypothetical protein
MIVLRKNKQIMPFGNEQTQENEEKAQKSHPTRIGWLLLFSFLSDIISAQQDT